MKKYNPILSTIFLLLLIFLTCQKNPVSFSLEAISEFSTEPRPHTILVDDRYGVIYIANSLPSWNNDSRKIQIFDMRGNYLKTIVDFANNQDGAYARYEPIDMTIDSDHNLCILVKPYRRHTDESWMPYGGFCLMNYSPDGIFQKEFDFAQFEMEWFPSAIAFHDEFIFVTNGQVLIKINKDNGQFYDVLLPIEKDDPCVWPEIHTTDMAVDSKGNIWLVGQAAFSDTTVGCHITRLDPTCTFRKTIYSKGRTKYYGAWLNNPGITLDKTDNIYLATFYCESLEIFNLNGKFLNQIEISGEENVSPIDVAVDNQNNIFLVDSLNNLVLIFKKH